MKTADLIPFILLELYNNNQYGIELTKNIETKSNGKIIIKQPTLYTVLKKLEKSKFISSYWEDSEIGGKRHYYKLTENGKLQVSTLPSFDVLLFNLNEDIDEEETDNTENLVTSDNVKKEENVIKEEAVEVNKDLPTNNSPIDSIKETILPTDQVFEDNNLDNQPITEINISNSSMLKTEKVNAGEQFAENNDVAKFTEKTSVLNDEVKQELNNITSLSSIVDIPDYQISDNESPIKYADYINFKTDKRHKQARKITKNIILKSLLTSAYLLLILIMSVIFNNKFGYSPLFYVCMIITICVLIFYPSIVINKHDKIRIKYQEKNYKNNLMKHIIIDTVILVVGFILLFLLNLKIVGNIGLIFNIKNFANMYSILLILLSAFVDTILEYILILKN